MIKKQLIIGVLISLLVCNSIASLHAQKTTGIAGTWMARGYGWFAEIDDQRIRIYDFTKISCTASTEYPLAMLSEGLSVSTNVLTLKRGVTQYSFDPIDALPDLCNQKLSKKKRNNPLFNFDVLWHTFNDQYAYFKERNVDWKVLHDTYRNKIDDATGKADLFAICDAMLEELNDGHVDISASDKIMKKAAVIGIWDTRPSADLKGTREAIIAKYIKTPKRHNISRTIWGKINDSIGYLQINSMGAQGEYGITDTTPQKEAQNIYLKYVSKTLDPFMDDINGINVTMKKVLNDLGDTKKIILDLRFNGGGEDMVGLAVLSYFVSTKKTVFHKKNRVADSFSEPYQFELSPAESTYGGKLFLLQSHWSASATEILLLSSLAYEDIMRLGSPSEGIFSDILEKKLPNRWEFGLSNQVYQDTDGISYEAKGIPVHVDLDYPKDAYELVDKLKKDLGTTGDTAIEHVISH